MRGKAPVEVLFPLFKQRIATLELPLLDQPQALLGEEGPQRLLCLLVVNRLFEEAAHLDELCPGLGTLGIERHLVDVVRKGLEMKEPPELLEPLLGSEVVEEGSQHRGQGTFLLLRLCLLGEGPSALTVSGWLHYLMNYNS